MQPVSRRARLVAKVRPIAARGNPLHHPAHAFFRRVTSPKKRTSPPRSPSPATIAFRIFATSIPTKTSLKCSTARPPAVRIGSATPSNPRRRSVGEPLRLSGHVLSASRSMMPRFCSSNRSVVIAARRPDSGAMPNNSVQPFHVLGSFAEPSTMGAQRTGRRQLPMLNLVLFLASIVFVSVVLVLLVVRSFPRAPEVRRRLHALSFMIVPWGLAILSGPFVIDHHAVGTDIRAWMITGQYTAMALLFGIATAGVVRARGARGFASAIGVANIILLFLLVGASVTIIDPGSEQRSAGVREPSAAHS